MTYVDEANAYAVAAAKLAGKYEFLLAMQQDVTRIYMTKEDQLEALDAAEERLRDEEHYAAICEQNADKWGSK